MATVIIQKIQPNGRGAFFITGTIGGVAHKMRLDNRPFLPEEYSTALIAAEFDAHYDDRVAASALLNSQTVYVRLGENSLSTVIFDGTALGVDSFDDFTLTGTVGGTSTVALVNVKYLLQMYKARTTAEFKDWAAKLLYEQRLQDVANAAFISTFTVA